MSEGVADGLVGFGHLDRAEVTGVDHPLDLPVGRGAATLVAHLERYARRLRSRDGSSGLLDRQRQRLLHEHRLARGGCGFDDLPVRRVRGGNDDAVHGGRLEHRLQ